MESFYFLIPIALIFVAIALRFLFWAIHSGQYDNLDTEAHRILFDDTHPTVKTANVGEETAAPDSPPVDSTATPTKPETHHD